MLSSVIFVYEFVGKFKLYIRALILKLKLYVNTEIVSNNEGLFPTL